MSNAAAYSTAVAVAFAFTISSGMIKSVLAEMDADVTLCNCTKQLGSLHAVSARRAVTKDRCAATSKSSMVASMVKTSVITVDSFVTMVADAGKGEYGESVVVARAMVAVKVREVAVKAMVVRRGWRGQRWRGRGWRWRGRGWRRRGRHDRKVRVEIDECAAKKTTGTGHTA